MKSYTVEILPITSHHAPTKYTPGDNTLTRRPKWTELVAIKTFEKGERAQAVDFAQKIEKTECRVFIVTPLGLNKDHTHRVRLQEIKEEV